MGRRRSGVAHCPARAARRGRAPARRPSSSAAATASSSSRPRRAVLTSTLPRRTDVRRRASSRPAVSAVSARCSSTRSARARASSSATGSAATARAASGRLVPRALRSAAHAAPAPPRYRPSQAYDGGRPDARERCGRGDLVPAHVRGLDEVQPPCERERERQCVRRELRDAVVANADDGDAGAWRPRQDPRCRGRCRSVR